MIMKQNLNKYRTVEMDKSGKLLHFMLIIYDKMHLRWHRHSLVW